MQTCMTNAALADELLQRKVPEDSCAFWACLCRAFPNAATNHGEYLRMAANLGGFYNAGFETTAKGLAFTLAALAADADSMRVLEEV